MLSLGWIKDTTNVKISFFRTASYKLLTTSSKFVDIVRLVTRLFQQGCYNHDITILL